jgi:hypothetical protein
MNNKKIIELTTDEITAISGGFKISEECKAYIGYAVGAVSVILLVYLTMYKPRKAQVIRECGYILRESHIIHQVMYYDYNNYIK